MNGHRKVFWTDGIPMGLRQIQCECGWKSKTMRECETPAMEYQARLHDLREEPEDDGFITVYATGAWE